MREGVICYSRSLLHVNVLCRLGLYESLSWSRMVVLADRRAKRSSLSSSLRCIRNGIVPDPLIRGQMSPVPTSITTTTPPFPGPSTTTLE